MLLFGPGVFSNVVFEPAYPYGSVWIYLLGVTEVAINAHTLEINIREDMAHGKLLMNR